LLWAGCVAGALDENEYRAKLAAAGFEQITIEPTRVYSIEDARKSFEGSGLDLEAIASEVEGKFISGFVRGVKPLATVPQLSTKAAAEKATDSCCKPTCCR
jgi:hypothetical protein